MLEHMSIYIHFLYIFLITFSISMYIMCVCLFSALSRWVGALQISIIIIINSPRLIIIPCDTHIIIQSDRPILYRCLMSDGEEVVERPNMAESGKIRTHRRSNEKNAIFI